MLYKSPIYTNVSKQLHFRYHYLKKQIFVQQYLTISLKSSTNKFVFKTHRELITLNSFSVKLLYTLLP